MIRSLNTGVLGIKQFQTSLDAIGNNLANINTIGFKGARVDFSDTLAQTMRAPTPDTDTTSGQAGMQVGNGVTVSAIKNQFTQGAIKQTGVRTDMAITGEGFFMVKDATTNELFVTRAGDFREDKNGFLVTNDGFRVQGLNKQAPANTAAEKLEIGDIKLDVGKYTEDRSSVLLDTSTNVFTKTAHAYSTGNQVKFTGTVPNVAGGTSTTSTVYFVAKVTDDTFSLHNTAADAASGANKVNYTVPSPLAITVSSVTYGSDYMTINDGSSTSPHLHDMATGDTFYVTGGTMPGGITDGKAYFARVSHGGTGTTNDIYFHTTAADAAAVRADVEVRVDAGRDPVVGAGVDEVEDDVAVPEEARVAGLPPGRRVALAVLLAAGLHGLKHEAILSVTLPALGALSAVHVPPMKVGPFEVQEALGIHLLPHQARVALDFRGFRGGYETELDRLEKARRNIPTFRTVGRVLKDHAEEGDSIVLGAIGAIGYESGIRVHDRNGLIDPLVTRIAERVRGRSAGHERRVSRQRFLRPPLDREPTWFGVRAVKRSLNSRDEFAAREAAALVMRNVIASDARDDALKDSCIPEVAPLGDSDSLLLLRYTKDTAAARAYWERAFRGDP